MLKTRLEVGLYGPALPALAPNHTATSFPSNIISVCRITNTDQNACKIVLKLMRKNC